MSPPLGSSRPPTRSESSRPTPRLARRTSTPAGSRARQPPPHPPPTPAERGAVEPARVVLGHRLAVALCPIGEDGTEQIARPCGTDFEDGEAQFREPHRNTTEQEGARRQLPRGREVPDVIEHVVGR